MPHQYEFLHDAGASVSKIQATCKENEQNTKEKGNIYYQSETGLWRITAIRCYWLILPNDIWNE